ncbi:hypothetical protein [Gordonia sp. ABSL49_1]|uniref:hypothetical protein n=1 Tax=unclassified Gordonia (in: high G+C Gram-positive bacteria) TaxID=2657482 RepID=UPI001F102FAC|nr:hypothetical protein [Gordonia sp. ABSL49_1]MCH5644984.1 hypothetical protein [Gordonia sp. ABSL49_1]
MQTITLSRSDAKNYADLVFGEWPAHRRFGHQAGSMPEWQQMALIKEIRDGTTITNLQIFHDGAWAHPPRDLPFALDEAIDDVAQQARAHAQELSVIFTVERATRTMQLRLVTGNEALPWFLWRQVPERLDALFGRTRDLTAGARPISLEDNHLRGTTVCLASNTTTPFTVISSAPSVTRELTIVSDHRPDDEIRVPYDQLLIRDKFLPEHHAGEFTQDLVGVWRMHSAHQSGDEPQPIEAPIELTIRADGSFYELSDGVDPAIYFFDSEGAGGHLGRPFHGYLATADGRDYVMGHNGTPNGIARVADDLDIVEELVRDGDQLCRTQNVVVDGIHRYRTTMLYRRVE